ncbi:RNase P subunit p30-domain-containing protein [Schizophyllum amplum]|uniref:RNase P subunit p30-domain-containing protein n=1 Tax=Schizophyllum amplum TaxID=97359 RepID=A0A550CKS1_9AGAR|nr:RNase P subunit p30-domain-containing protein [Auriculariopsis ampla]
MYFDLNVPIQCPSSSSSKKGKAKQGPITFSAAEINAIEARIELLVHLGYTVLAFTQTLHKKIDPKVNANILDVLIPQLRSRPGVLFLKRLNVILDSDSEKGFGLTSNNQSFLNSYDILGLVPTSLTTFNLACLTHSQPSPLTAHIITVPVTLPRVPFYMKHTPVRTALKNGAVFELTYVGALGGRNDEVLVDAGAAEDGTSAKKNWWAAARELARVTKGKGILVSSGACSDADIRAPRDVSNLISIVGLPQNLAHDTSTVVPKSLLIRAQTRKTYRAVLSEPKVVIPGAASLPSLPAQSLSTIAQDLSTPQNDVSTAASAPEASVARGKRPREDVEDGTAIQTSSVDEKRKKKRKKQRLQAPAA